MRNFGDYEGVSYFSAALLAGMMLHPIVGQGPAATHDGRELRYDPGHSLATQRHQVIGQIAARLAMQDGCSPYEYARLLNRAILPT